MGVSQRNFLWFIIYNHILVSAAYLIFSDMSNISIADDFENVDDNDAFEDDDDLTQDNTQDC